MESLISSALQSLPSTGARQRHGQGLAGAASEQRGNRSPAVAVGQLCRRYVAAAQRCACALGSRGRRGQAAAHNDRTRRRWRRCTVGAACAAQQGAAHRRPRTGCGQRSRRPRGSRQSSSRRCARCCRPRSAGSCRNSLGWSASHASARTCAAAARGQPARRPRVPWRPDPEGHASLTERKTILHAAEKQHACQAYLPQSPAHPPCWPTKLSQQLKGGLCRDARRCTQQPGRPRGGGRGRTRMAPAGSAAASGTP